MLKATGCFPKSSPVGGIMNQNEGEVTIPGAAKFSIQFVVNHIDLDDPVIIKEFNMLAERYCEGIDKYPTLDMSPHNNFFGLPYIATTKYGPELQFKDIQAEQLPETEYPDTSENASKQSEEDTEKMNETIFREWLKAKKSSDEKERQETLNNKDKDTSDAAMEAEALKAFKDKF